jgi:hypothetical protein
VNIAAAQAISIADIGTTLPRLASGTTLPRLASRPDLPQLGALPDRLDEPPRIVADVRACADVKAEPPGQFEQGLAEALEFWRAVASP